MFVKERCNFSIFLRISAILQCNRTIAHIHTTIYKSDAIILHSYIATSVQPTKKVKNYWIGTFQCCLLPAAAPRLAAGLMAVGSGLLAASLHYSSTWSQWPSAPPRSALTRRPTTAGWTPLGCISLPASTQAHSSLPSSRRRQPGSNHRIVDILAPWHGVALVQHQYVEPASREQIDLVFNSMLLFDGAASRSVGEQMTRRTWRNMLRLGKKTVTEVSLFSSNWPFFKTIFKSRQLEKLFPNLTHPSRANWVGAEYNFKHAKVVGV